MTMSGERSLFMVYVVFLFVSSSVIQINHALELAKEGGAIQERALIPNKKYIITPANELLDLPEKRIGPTSCSKDNILVNQGALGTLPNGIPTYTAIVENVCVSEGSCSISNIHLSCGWFSSARLINPTIFRRLKYNDCLVNDGKPLKPGQSITFQYANTFKYPLSVSSVTCN